MIIDQAFYWVGVVTVSLATIVFVLWLFLWSIDLIFKSSKTFRGVIMSYVYHLQEKYRREDNEKPAH